MKVNMNDYMKSNCPFCVICGYGTEIGEKCFECDTERKKNICMNCGYKTEGYDRCYDCEEKHNIFAHCMIELLLKAQKDYKATGLYKKIDDCCPLCIDCGNTKDYYYKCYDCKDKITIRDYCPFCVICGNRKEDCGRCYDCEIKKYWKFKDCLKQINDIFDPELIEVI